MKHREKDLYQISSFQKLLNQKQDLPMTAMFVCLDRYERIILYRGPSIDASYRVSVHLAKRLNIHSNKLNFFAGKYV
jgi:hypothetical protein